MHVNEVVAHSSKLKLAEEKRISLIVNSSKKNLENGLVAVFKSFNEELKLDQQLLNEVTARGRGDYVGFNYDQPSANGPITITFPDGRTTTVNDRAEAARVSDEWNQRNRAPAPNPDQERRDQEDRERERQRQADRNSPLARRFRQLSSPRQAFMSTWTYTVAAALGINLEIHDIQGAIIRALGIENSDAISGQGDFESLLDFYYTKALVGQLAPSTRDADRTEEDFYALDEEEIERIQEVNFQIYGRILSTAFGVYLAVHYFAICSFLGVAPVTGTLRSVLVRATRGRVPAAPSRFIFRPKNVKAFFRALRASWTGIAAAAGAIAGAGIGGLATGAITFLITTAAFWLIERILVSSGVAETVIEGLVNLVLAADKTVYLSWVDDVVEFTGGTATIWAQEQGAQVAKALGAPEIANAINTAREYFMNDPSLTATQRGQASNIPDMGTGEVERPTPAPGSGASVQDLGLDSWQPAN